MYRPRDFAVKEFLRNTIVLPNYKKPKPARCEQVQHFCRTTANHGFAHLVDTEELFCFRIIWALIIATFIGVVVMLLYESAASLIARKLTTEFVDVDGNTKEEGMTLPDIHICDATIFKATELNKMGFNSTMATYLALATSQYAASPSIAGDTDKRKILEKEFQRILEENVLTMSTIIERAALNCMDILIGCDYGDKTYNAEDCCKQFFKSDIYVTIFGSCISTHNTTIVQASESRDAGFVVYTRLNTNNSIDFDFTLIDAEYTLQRGVYFAVSSPSVYIKTVLETEGRFAIPNTWISLPISKTEIDITEVKDSSLAPYTCVDTTDPKYREMRAPEYDYYSLNNCLNAFDHAIYQEYDNCTPTFLKHNRTTNYIPLKILTRISLGSAQLCTPAIILSYDKDTFKTKTRAKGWCPVECQKDVYKLSPSFALYNSDYLKEILNATNTDTDWAVVLHFFYPSFTYQKQIIHVNTYLKFLGEVGGNLGLFLGASLISILEIVALFFRCCLKAIPVKL